MRPSTHNQINHGRNIYDMLIEECEDIPLFKFYVHWLVMPARTVHVINAAIEHSKDTNAEVYGKQRHPSNYKPVEPLLIICSMAIEHLARTTQKTS